jgi:MFS family permease
MMLASKLLLRIGLIRVSFKGSVLIGLGYLICSTISFSPSLTILVLSVGFGIVVGFGTGLIYIIPIAMINRLMSGNKGFALGFVLMGFGLSALLTAPLSDVLIKTLGISFAFLTLGIVYLAILSFLSFALKRLIITYRPDFLCLNSEARLHNEASENPLSKTLLRKRTFYLTWVTYAIGIGIGHAIIAFAKLIAIDIGGLKGDLDYLATYAVSILAIGNTVLRPFYGMIADNAGPKHALIIVQLVQLLCLTILLPISNNLPILYLTLFLMGGTYGAYFVVMPLLTSFLYGGRYFEQNYGALFTAYGVGGVSVPMFFSVILNNRSDINGYIQSFYSLAVLIILALILTQFIKPSLENTTN